MADPFDALHCSRSSEIGKKLEAREYKFTHALLYFYQDETKFVSFAAMMAVFHLRGRFK